MGKDGGWKNVCDGVNISCRLGLILHGVAARITLTRMVEYKNCADMYYIYASGLSLILISVCPIASEPNVPPIVCVPLVRMLCRKMETR